MKTREKLAKRRKTSENAKFHVFSRPPKKSFHETLHDIFRKKMLLFYMFHEIYHKLSHFFADISRKCHKMMLVSRNMSQSLYFFCEDFTKKNIFRKRTTIFCEVSYYFIFLCEKVMKKKSPL